MSDNRLHLKSFAAGDTIRVFQAENSNGETEILNVQNNIYKNEKYIEYKPESWITYHYLMKDKKSGTLNQYFTENFINFLNESINNDASSDVYYNNIDIACCCSSMNLLQCGKKIYFLGNNEYVDDDYYESYEIKQFQYDNELNQLLCEYIANNYDDYYDASHHINNKSMPIYKLDGKALNDIHFIRLFNSNDIYEMINNEKFGLSGYADKILFNSEECRLNSSNYDAILIDGVLDALLANEEDDLENKAKEIFEYIFTHIPKKSFFRVLIPVGNIKIMEDEKSANEISQYLYSINVNDNSEDIPTNYLSLKNIKSPELYQDYTLSDIENIKHVRSNEYDLSYNIISEVLRSYEKIVISNLYSLLSACDIRNMSGKFIAGDADLMKSLGLDRDYSIFDDLITMFMQIHPRYNRKDVEEYFYNNYNYKMIGIFKSYMKKEYNIDLSKNRIFLKIEDFHKKVVELFNEFNEDMDKVLSALIAVDPENEEVSTGIKVRFIHFENIIGGVISSKINPKEPYSDEALNELLNDISRCSVSDVVNVVDDIIEAGYFKPGIYNGNARDILNNASIIDNNAYYDAYNGGYLNAVSADYFPIRLDGKIQDYMSVYQDLFEKENNMEKTGIIHGKRLYNGNISKTSRNDICIEYEYHTTKYSNFLENTMSGKITEDDPSYRQMMDSMKHIKFVDILKGQHYYKESDVHKSNVFSLNVKNSGLKYDLYSYDDMLRIINDKIDELSDNDYEDACSGFITDSILSTLHYGKVNANVDKISNKHPLELAENTTDEKEKTYRKITYNEYLKNFKFFKFETDDPENETRLMASKVHLRSLFEDAVRKSIHRYIPANTILWKIEYDK